MQKSVVSQLKILVEEGANADSDRDIELWSSKASSFLNAALGEVEAREFKNIENFDDWVQHARRLGHLQGIIANAEDQLEQTNSLTTPPIVPSLNTNKTGSHETRKVFIVHGHDDAAKEATARFLEKLDLQPIILHEQASGGQTIIEKFEKYSGDVGFAVILLTPDDFGGTGKETSKMHPRARQNVVLELGYFMGKLTRNHVCALYKGGVELPSDIQGVIYIEMDEKGAWKAKLAQEFVQAKLPINLEGLIGN